MKILLFMVWMGSVCAQYTNDVFNCTGCGLTSVPTNISNTITKIYLGKNNITLNDADQKTLINNSLITELHLNDNNITILPPKLFSGLSKLEVLNLSKNSVKDIDSLLFKGLENLTTLDLSYNHIEQLPSDLSFSSQHLQALYLQHNGLSSLEVPADLKKINSSLKITLSVNPWNCDCSLTNLIKWLNGNAITLEDEALTHCATPKNMTKLTIKEALTDNNNCNDGSEGSVTSPPVAPSNSPKGEVTTSLMTATVNGTTNTPRKGNSWTFLVGVLIVALVTSLLILFAVKFPRWYDFLLSYNHHRLKEEEPYMFEEEFSVDLNMSTSDKIREEDDTVVVFEQMHSFIPEEDGFIEDKYIEDHDVKAET
ncbi:leucine-rich repeat-containing protein 19 [Discoglossus pictus]